MIKFKVEYLKDNSAINIIVTYGDFKDNDSMCTAFVHNGIDDSLCKLLQSGLNSIMSNKPVKFDKDNNPIYLPSFEEKLTEKIKETE